MDEFEMLLFIGFAIGTCVGFYHWVQVIAEAWPPNWARAGRFVLSILPVAALLMMLYTLRSLASYDVVTSTFFILFYVLLGYCWIFFGMILVKRLWDLSWRDDVMNLNNRAAMVTVAGTYLGFGLIYCGANIGDGPGWWCVVVAGGMGTAAWLALGVLLHRITGAFERVTVDRDRDTGMRLTGYLIASALLLARASSGDWTSFSRTVVEFVDGWPVLPLTLAFVLSDKLRAQMAQGAPVHTGRTSASAWIEAALYVSAAILCLTLLPPIPQNPLY